MKTFHFMDDNSAVHGPVVLSSLANLPPDTLVREVGQTKWENLRLARKRYPDAAISPPSQSPAQEPESMLYPCLAAVVGYLAAGFLASAGMQFPAIMFGVIGCAGIGAVIATAAKFKQGIGWVAGGALGPLGWLVLVVLWIVREAKK